LVGIILPHRRSKLPAGLSLIVPLYVRAALYIAVADGISAVTIVFSIPEGLQNTRNKTQHRHDYDRRDYSEDQSGPTE
jgi:hypothetical protein